jgi:hypothetical protein
LEAVWEYFRSSWNIMEGRGRVARGVTGRPHLVAPLDMVSSDVFYTLLVYVLSRIILVIIDTLILFLLFSGLNPANL